MKEVLCASQHALHVHVFVCIWKRKWKYTWMIRYITALEYMCAYLQIWRNIDTCGLCTERVKIEIAGFCWTNTYRRLCWLWYPPVEILASIITWTPSSEVRGNKATKQRLSPKEMDTMNQFHFLFALHCT